LQLKLNFIFNYEFHGIFLNCPNQAAAGSFPPRIGLTHVSNPALLRFGYSYEIQAFGRKVARMFGGRP